MKMAKSGSDPRPGPMRDDEWVTVDGVRYEPRHKVIEECAQVADEWLNDRNPLAKTIAAAIRARKDKSDKPMDEIDHLNAIMEIARNATIEECARVAELNPYAHGLDIAAAIRAKKDKP